jgi:hypothetical protein
VAEVVDKLRRLVADRAMPLDVDPDPDPGT